MAAVSIPRLRRVLPGFAWKDQFDRIVTARGTVIQVSTSKVWIETDSKIIGNPTGGAYGKVCLLGDTYIYICERCPATVYHAEIEAMRTADIERIESMPAEDRRRWEIEHRTVMRPRPPRCPFCSGQIRFIRTGETVELHYRFATDGSSGAWWATRK